MTKGSELNSSKIPRI